MLGTKPLEPCFRKDIRKWWYENRWLLFIVLMAAMVLYYPVYTYGLENLDSNCTTEPYTADLWGRILYWETQQGRWALRLSDTLTSGMHPWAFHVFFICFFMAVAAVQVCDLLKLKSFSLRVVSVLLLVCSQYVQNIQTYRYCGLSYAISLWLAVQSVSCVVTIPSLWGVLAGALCLTLSVALYQASLGAAAIVCLFVLIITLLRTPGHRPEVFRKLMRMLCMGVLGMLLYLLILKVFLFVYGVTLANINGIDQVGAVETLIRVPHGIVQAYRDFWEYFFGRTVAQNFYATRPAGGIVFLLGACSGILALYRCRNEKKSCVMATILIILIPFAANLTDIINPNTQILLRMAGAMALMPLFVIALAEDLPQRKTAMYHLTGVIVLLSAIFLLRGYVLQSNNDITVLQADKQQAVEIAEQISADIMSNDAYYSGVPIAVLGRPCDGLYQPGAREYREKANPLVQWGAFWLGTEANLDTWKHLFRTQLGMELNWCSYEQAESVRKTDAYSAMPMYPQAGSIALIDDVLVVKVSA